MRSGPGAPGTLRPWLAGADPAVDPL